MGGGHTIVIAFRYSRHRIPPCTVYSSKDKSRDVKMKGEVKGEKTRRPDGDVTGSPNRLSHGGL